MVMVLVNRIRERKRGRDNTIRDVGVAIGDTIITIVVIYDVGAVRVVANIVIVVG